MLAGPGRGWDLPRISVGNTVLSKGRTGKEGVQRGGAGGDINLCSVKGLNW